MCPLYRSLQYLYPEPIVGDKKILSAFLYYGYIPHIPQDINEQDWLTTKEESTVISKPVTEAFLINEGVQKLKQLFTHSDKGLQVILLSGGLDSRAILGGLIESGFRDQLVTVTFGVPGTWDYRIGRLVAQHANVRHYNFDLRDIVIKQEALEETARKLNQWMWLFDAFFIRQLYEQFGTEPTYWSGFMGDPLSGSHVTKQPSQSWQIALQRFARRNKFCRSLDLRMPGFDPTSVLPQSPICDPCQLGYDDQLDFFLRQFGYIKQIVLPNRYNTRTPFLRPEWTDFVLNLPHHLRYNQYLYKKILYRTYPDLFSLPTKTNYGLPICSPTAAVWLRRQFSRAYSGLRRHIYPQFWSIHPAENYIDFDRQIRENDHLKKLIYINIKSLKERLKATWIDLDVLWHRHQLGQANNGRVLTLLASLEIYLKLGETTR
jgi:hypothetical protein